MILTDSLAKLDDRLRNKLVDAVARRLVQEVPEDGSALDGL
jgi:hypothetical protein